MPRNMPFKIYTENRYMWALSLAIVSISTSIAIGDGTETRSISILACDWLILLSPWLQWENPKVFSVYYKFFIAFTDSFVILTGKHSKILQIIVAISVLLWQKGYKKWV